MQEEIYFDNAATSHPKPPCVLAAVQKAMTQQNANPGRSGHARALAAGRVVMDTREALRRLLGASPEDTVVHTFNCTDALNLAIRGSLHRGDHVISTMLEHNSVLRCLCGLQARGDISLTLLMPEPDGFIDPDRILSAIMPETRLIALTHASNVTGAIQPVSAVGQIARTRGIRYLVDGAQALGALPVDVKNIFCDMYAFPGHKSLLGPTGTGGLYIRSGVSLRAFREGGTGSSSDMMTQPEELPEKYESGTLNLHGIAGLGAGVEYVSGMRKEILTREREICRHLTEGLAAMRGVTLYSPRQSADCASIVAFNVKDAPSEEVADFLAARNVCVRAGLHCAPGAHAFLKTIRRGVVRASIGHANTISEADTFLSLIREFIAAH